MSGYNGRRGPNVSEYIANLNTIPSPSDQTLDPQNLDDDFALFTNADFADAGNFNMDVPLDFGFAVNDQPSPTTQPTPAASNNAAVSANPKMDFSLSGMCFTSRKCFLYSRLFCPFRFVLPRRGCRP